MEAYIAYLENYQDFRKLCHEIDWLMQEGCNLIVLAMFFLH